MGLCPQLRNIEIRRSVEVHCSPCIILAYVHPRLRLDREPELLRTHVVAQAENRTLAELALRLVGLRYLPAILERCKVRVHVLVIDDLAHELRLLGEPREKP